MQIRKIHLNKTLVTQSLHIYWKKGTETCDEKYWHHLEYYVHTLKNLRDKLRTMAFLIFTVRSGSYKLQRTQYGLLENRIRSHIFACANVEKPF